MGNQGWSADDAGAARTALAGVVATALRAPRHPRSAIAAILGSYAAGAAAEVVGAFAIADGAVVLLAAGGVGARLVGCGDLLDPSVAEAVRCVGSQECDERLVGPWLAFGTRSWYVVTLGDDASMVLLAASTDPEGLRIPVREIAGPVSALAAVTVAQQRGAWAADQQARTRQDHAMVVAGLQHDLRSSLHAVVSAAITLRDRGEQLDAEVRARLLTTVVTQAERAADLASSGLRQHADDAPVRYVVTELSDLVRGVADAAQASRGGQVVVDLPPLRTITDPVRLERALLNLVDNALKYGGAAGPVYVQVERSGTQVALTVADQGPGVPDELLPSLFGAYVTGSADTGGTGVGLHSVRSLAGELGGRVTYSRRGDGWTRFCLVIPDHEPAPVAAPVAALVEELV